MPANAAMKRKVRERMKVTGEKYMTARRAVEAEIAAYPAASNPTPDEPQDAPDHEG